MTPDLPLFTPILITVFVVAPCTMVILLFVDAPYGRYDSTAWGPGLGARLSWVLLESSSFFAFGFFYLTGPLAFTPLPLFFFFLYEIHYLYRAFVFPFRIRSRADRQHRLVILVLGVTFNIANGYLNGAWLSHASTNLDLGWLADPRFAGGVALYLGGALLCRRSDQALIDLRAPGETGYKIPHGGGFDYVSSPHYLGEMVQWLGFAIATWSPAALAFFVFTGANLVPRALANHRWYHERFADEYPRERKALIPYVF